MVCKSSESLNFLTLPLWFAINVNCKLVCLLAQAWYQNPPFDQNGSLIANHLLELVEFVSQSKTSLFVQMLKLKKLMVDRSFINVYIILILYAKPIFLQKVSY